MPKSARQIVACKRTFSLQIMACARLVAKQKKIEDLNP